MAVVREVNGEGGVGDVPTYWLAIGAFGIRADDENLSIKSTHLLIRRSVHHAVGLQREGFRYTSRPSMRLGLSFC